MTQRRGQIFGINSNGLLHAQPSFTSSLLIYLNLAILNMSLVLSYCKDEDFPTLTDIIFGATDGGPADKCDPLFDALYPHWNTPEGRQSHCRRFIHWRNVDNCAHWLKVTDIDTDEIIACGQWAIYGNAPTAVFVATPTLLDTYDTPEEEEYGDAVFKAFHKEREKVQKEISGSLLCMLVSKSDINLVRARHLKTTIITPTIYVMKDYKQKLTPSSRPQLLASSSEAPAPRCRQHGAEMGNRASGSNRGPGKQYVLQSQTLPS